MKILAAITGIGLILISLVFCVVSLFAIIDPVEFKMSDDNDPFGPPPGRTSSLAMLCIFVAVGAGGVYLVREPFQSRRDIKEPLCESRSPGTTKRRDY